MFIGDAGAGIAHRQYGIIPGFDLLVSAQCFFHKAVARGDGDNAAGRHRFNGIQDKVHNGFFQMHRRPRHVEQVRRQLGINAPKYHFYIELREHIDQILQLSKSTGARHLYGT